MLINSHMDTLVVNAMHQYNVAASRMGLPSRTKAVEKLADDLSKCSDNVKVSIVCLSTIYGLYCDTVHE